MMKQIRKALNDIYQSVTTHDDIRKAAFQVYYLRKMIDQQPLQPWAHYQPLIEEEFEGAE